MLCDPKIFGGKTSEDPVMFLVRRLSELIHVNDQMGHIICDNYLY